MTIGRSSSKSKSPRAPPFLDKANGFYGRLDEMFGEDGPREKAEEPTAAEEVCSREDMTASAWKEEEEHVADDDGTSLLKRKPSRLSLRWSRMSSRKYDRFSQEKELVAEAEKTPRVDQTPVSAEPVTVHFCVREHRDDQVLISHANKAELQAKEKETHVETQRRPTEVVKRNTLKNYRKAVDRALRRGWQTFVSNLHSVTLTPISPTSSSPSDPNNASRKQALAEFR